MIRRLSTLFLASTICTSRLLGSLLARSLALIDLPLGEISAHERGLLSPPIAAPNEPLAALMDDPAPDFDPRLGLPGSHSVRHYRRS